MKTNNYFTTVAALLVASGANAEKTSTMNSIPMEDTILHNTISHATQFKKEIITTDPVRCSSIKSQKTAN